VSAGRRGLALGGECSGGAIVLSLYSIVVETARSGTVEPYVVWLGDPKLNVLVPD
jgi:hypothetical protein